MPSSTEVGSVHVTIKNADGSNGASGEILVRSSYGAVDLLNVLVAVDLGGPGALT